MTGYGRSECDLPGMVLAIEIKSLNSKQLDISVKLPGLLRNKEVEIRNMLCNELQRGKIEIGIQQEMKEGASAYSINRDVVKQYIRQLMEIGQEAGLVDKEAEDPGHLLQVAMRLPDAMKSEKDELSETEWELVRESIGKALKDLQAFREQEGRAMEQDISMRIHSISAGLAKIEPFEEERIGRVRKRVLAALDEIGRDVKADANRLEQEMIIYLEKMDITEEKVRLRNHCKYFLETLHDDQSPGKKLGFIAQEMGREINTLGSKAADSDIQRFVVEMKDELEKIREQILNIL